MAWYHRPKPLPPGLRPEEPIDPTPPDVEGFIWYVTWGDTVINPNAPPLKRTRRQRLADWWEWSVKERWLDFRWSLSDMVMALALRLRP